MCETNIVNLTADGDTAKSKNVNGVEILSHCKYQVDIYN